MIKRQKLKTGILFGILTLCIIFILILFSIKFADYVVNKSESSNKKEKNICIKMDAVVTYSRKEYSVFSTAEFSNFVVFEQPTRDFYAPVVLTIDTKNTSNTIDDEVIKVKDRDPEVINSTGGDIYEY